MDWSTKSKFLSVSLIILFVILMSAGNVYATAQIPEDLIYNNEYLKIHTLPLEAYFYKQGSAPEFDPVNTACRRRYRATWKIESNFLYLVDIHATVNKKAFKISDLFPGSEVPVKATWFTGTLVVPKGKMIQYVHAGFESKYPGELRIKIKNGQVINEELIKNPLPPGYNEKGELDYKNMQETLYESMGSSLFNYSELTSLRTLLDQGLKNFPNNAKLWDLEGGYYYKKQDPEKSIMAFKHAFEIEPTDQRNQNIAWCYYRLAKDYQSALTYFKKSESMADESPKVHYYMAICFEKTGDPESYIKQMTVYQKKLLKAIEEFKADLKSNGITDDDLLYDPVEHLKETVLVDELAKGDLEEIEERCRMLIDP